MTTVTPIVGEGDGPIIGLLLRVSTSAQVGNNRSEVQADMTPYLLAQGFRVRVYDELGVSGADLTKRKVTLRMLDDVKQGQIQGIAALDVKRLTRDEFGIDGGTIAKLLVDVDAMLVTWGKTYDLRDEDDLLQFQFQCMLAGIDWRSIRNTFWSGIFKRLEKGPMFLRPPLGYMTEYLPGERPGQLIKRPAKNPEQVKLMAEIAAAFDQCGTLGQVTRRLAERGYTRPPIRYRGEVRTHWTIELLRYILQKNPIYSGVWEFGGPTRKNGQKRSNVWHKFGRDAAGNHKVYRFEVPDLAYWSAARARRWKEKFKISTEGPRSRERKHPHPLLSVVVCAGCDGPMIGGGKDAYVCRHHRTSGCLQPQRISEHIICALLRTVLDDTFKTASDLAERAERQITVQAPSDQALRLAQVQERSRALAKRVVAMDHVNEDLMQELDDLQGEINRLRDVVADEEAERAAAEELRESLERVRRAPLEQFEKMTPEQQRRLYALLFRNVRIGYQGLGPARRWWLEQYETLYSDGPIRVEHPHVARPVPWSAQRGLPALQIEAPAVAESNTAKPDSGRAIKAYLASLRELSGALRIAS